MGRVVIRETKKMDRQTEDRAAGFGDWGSYMDAKRAKLLDQFENSEIKKVSNIFAGVAILVNGLTRPPADELKNMMAAHGGVYHMYQSSNTTHIIASNLPNVKVKHLGTVPIVKPSWITDSISMGKLLDFKRYLLYTNQSKTQPRLEFNAIQKPPNDTVDVVPPCNKIALTSNEGESKLPMVTSITETSKQPTKTAADPNFLQEFYQNSRLHLISTLGAEFKQLVNKLRETSDGTFPGRDKLLLMKGEGSPKAFYPSLSTVIMHIDMDCFFVSVGLRNRPELHGQPVAVTHARRGQLVNAATHRGAEFELWKRLDPGEKVDIGEKDSMSEIASCSYEARKYGIQAGMFLGQAMKRCPQLKTLPYDFEGYKEVSNILYKTIASYTLDIEAMSCDEMYVDVTKILCKSGLTVDEWATHIRKEIMDITGCPCSTGFGANRLQARLATRKAKPAGQFYLQVDDVESYMADIPLSDLPGVGRATLQKLRNLGLNTCGDVQVASLKLLQSEIGHKLGETLKDQARGIDNRPLNFTHERKSVSADVNYGIRFKKLEECYNFLYKLSEEVYNRMNDINMRARSLTLKLLVRAPEAPVETAKYLGCGVCESITKTSTGSVIFNDPKLIYKEVISLFEKISPPFIDLRGVGIQLTKLERNAPVNGMLVNFLKQGRNKNSDNTDQKENVDDSNSKIPEKILQHNDNSLMSKTNGNIEKVKHKYLRGRPKSNKTVSLQRTRSVSTIRDFLNRSRPRTTHKKEVFANEMIDLSILKELPEDLRNEIIKEYELEDKIHQQQAVIKQSSHKRSKSSSLSGLTSDQIRPVIKKWIVSESAPREVDVEIIANHFRQMALDRRIEELQRTFNFLFRTFSNLSCCWHKGYYLIMNTMQEGMVARYGYTLMVKRTFDCCSL